MLFSPVRGLSSEGGGRFPGLRHDGDAGGGRWFDSAAGSQDATQSPSKAYIQIPDPALIGCQGDRWTPTVAITCQTCEGSHIHACQVGRCFLEQNKTKNVVKCRIE